jgi:protein TonB
VFDIQVPPPQPKPLLEPQPSPQVPPISQRLEAPEPVLPTPNFLQPMLAVPEAPPSPEREEVHVPVESEAAPLPAAFPLRAAASPPVLAARAWVRKPSSSQLDRYRPAGSPAGWGVVSCRTAPGRRVTDCVEVESFPASSRLASAVKRAAWQFRIMPPRRNGEDLIGEWVQIRVDYVAPKQ